jgi:hypothetical protein
MVPTCIDGAPSAQNHGEGDRLHTTRQRSVPSFTIMARKAKAKKAAQARKKKRAKVVAVRLRTGNDGDFHVHVEKLIDAVDALVTGARPARLCEAFSYLRWIDPEDIRDEELRRIFVGVKDALIDALTLEQESRHKATIAC